MKFISSLLCFVLAFGSSIALADSINTTTGVRTIENPVSNGDMNLRVNVGGTKKDAVKIIGSTGNLTVVGALMQTVCSKSANYTVTTTDGCALVAMTTASDTVTLPDATTSVGRMITVKNLAASGTVTVNRAGSDTIDGLTSAAIYGQNGQITLMAASTVWSIVSWTDQKTFTPTITSGTGSTSSPAGLWQRNGRQITEYIDFGYSGMSGINSWTHPTSDLPDGGPGTSQVCGTIRRTNSNGSSGTMGRNGSVVQMLCLAAECGASGNAGGVMTYSN